MNDPKIDRLIGDLEDRTDMSDAEFEGVIHALEFLLPGSATTGLVPHGVRTTDGAMHIADAAYPNWAVNIHGRANDRDGHWRCTLREDDRRDNDAVLGFGRSPILAQAVLAALLRLAASQKKAGNAA